MWWVSEGTYLPGRPAPTYPGRSVLSSNTIFARLIVVQGSQSSFGTYIYYLHQHTMHGEDTPHTRGDKENDRHKTNKDKHRGRIP